MKITFALTALSTKIIMLLCVSSVSFMGMVQESKAAQPSPCHLEVAQKDKATEPCEMCEIALAVWEENAVATSEAEPKKAQELSFSADSIAREFVFELKPHEGVYQAYYPPPLVLLKAVTPSTKTIVLLS